MDVELDDVGAGSNAARIEGRVFSRNGCSGGWMRVAVQVSRSMPVASKVCARPRWASSAGPAGRSNTSHVVLLRKMNAASKPMPAAVYRSVFFMRSPNRPALNAQSGNERGRERMAPYFRRNT